MPTLTLLGTVFSGKGEGKKFVSLPWVKCQIEQKAGFVPFEGTLNLRLTQEGTQQKEKMQKAQKIRIEPAQGYCPGFLIKAQISDIQATIVLPEVPNYPANVVELIASVCLRTELGLADGDVVAVTVLV